MNHRLIIKLVLLAVLVVPTASAHVTMYFDPQDSSLSNGDTTYVKVMANITSPDDLKGGQFGIATDGTCIDIMDVQPGPEIFQFTWSWNAYDYCWAEDHDMIMYGFMSIQQPGVVEICNLTIHCNSTCGYCTSPLNFSCGADGCGRCPIEVLNTTTYELYPSNVTLENGTVAYGTPSSAETFSKDLYEGWNLISLPLTPEDVSASAVLSTVSYDTVYRYNATSTSKQFEGIESTDAMNPGTGYFVHVISECTWTYDGTADMSSGTSLEQGLNMVGWLNCSKGVDNALSSISGDYYYVARWNTSAEKFEVYNPVAPAAFNNDFTTVDRGTGYFISAKQACVLSENC